MRVKAIRCQMQNHILTQWNVVSSFYEGLEDDSNMLLDSSLNEVYLKLDYTEAEAQIEKISNNTSYWYNTRDSPKQVQTRIYEISDANAMDALIEAIFQKLSTKIEELVLQKSTKASTSSPCMSLILYCSHCGGSHADA